LSNFERNISSISSEDGLSDNNVFKTGLIWRTFFFLLDFVFIDDFFSGVP